MVLARERELGRIDELITQIKSRRGALVVLEGPAGIGKTTLVAEAAVRASSAGVCVLRAAGGRLEREHAFGVVRQLFGPPVAASRGAVNVPPSVVELAQEPFKVSGTGAGAHACEDDRTSAAMHWLYVLTTALAQRAPLLVALDDTHWADVMSLRFVLYLARRLAELPVLVLLATQPAADNGHGELLAELGALPATAWMRPLPLTDGDVARLIAAGGLPDAEGEFVAACRRASGGNPFLLKELVAAVRAQGAGASADDAAQIASLAPHGIARWVSARLAALGQQAQRLATAYAVLGASAELTDATTLAGIAPAAATAAADTLIAANILTARPPYEFVHPLVQAVVYDGLRPATRAGAHARAARLTAERGAQPARVAAHLLAADPARDRWAVEVLRAAAQDARVSGAHQSAARYLERALKEAMPRHIRVELLLELGEAQLQGAIAGATQRIADALELSTDRRRRAEICLTLGRAMFSKGDYPAARAAFRRGLAELPDQGDDLGLELHVRQITIGGHDAHRHAGQDARLSQLLADQAPGRTPLQRLLLAHAAFQSARTGEQPHEQVAALARRALADGALLNGSRRDMGPYGAACYALICAGEPGSAITALDPAIQSSQRHGPPVALGWFSLLRAIARYWRGELLDAIADLQQARAAYSDEYAHGMPATQAFLALCLLERDDLAGAADALARPGNDQPWPTQQPPQISYLYTLGRLRSAQGKLQEALKALLACEHRATELNASNPAANLSWRSQAALIATRLGDQQRALQLADEDLKLARAFGAPHALSIALRTAGLIQGATNGLKRLDEAVAVLDGAGIHLELARSLIEQGAAIRRAGRRRDAHQPLRRGLDLATHCGALTLAARAHEELHAAGARPRRERIHGPHALTASELRVARLAANGMTNRDIAQTLFITCRTVETHLTSIYRKLDTECRNNLAQALEPERAHPQPSQASSPRAPQQTNPYRLSHPPPSRERQHQKQTLTPV